MREDLLHPMAVIDIFSFNGELDVLDIRLNVLNDAVDEFIICESNETFTGLTKPLYFLENKDRYASFLHKIRHYHMSRPTMSLMDECAMSPGVPQHQHWWVREFCQKESMKYALTHLRDSDTVFIGDADEVWNPLYMPPLNARTKLEQTVYSYYLNNKSSEWWEGTSVMTYGQIRNQTLDNLRAHDTPRAYMKAPTFANKGWHFTNMYGNNAEKIKEKLNSYSHQEFNHPDVTDHIDEQIKNNKDFIGRDFTFTIDETGLPDYVLQNKAKYAHLWKA